MQERVKLTDAQINKDLLRSMEENPLWYWLLVGALGLAVLVAFAAVAYMFNRGLGVTGLNRPVMWGFFITNFVFWIGISHAGVMLSAILRLVQAEWRRPATRAAEVLTVFSLMTAMTMPLIHAGRPWRVMYWVFPLDWARGVYPNVRSALVWDPSAVFTYLTSSILFVFIALIPDIAVARDRTTGWKHVLYSVLALGWRGSVRQWKLQLIAGILLSAVILPIFVSVHSIVSWDFAAAVSVEGWHSTVFAPYFVIGAVHSGVSAVVTVMIILRSMFKWQDYIRLEHLDALAKLLIVVATTWFFFFVLEFLFGLYSLEGPEIRLREMQVFEMPWAAFFVAFLVCSYFIPVPMWLFRSVRRSIPLMIFTTVLVNVGMWLERFIIIVPGLARKQGLTFTWGGYTPSAVEIIIVFATFCMVSMLVLLFAKVFPLIPIGDAKEGVVLEDEIKIGKVKVPAIMRED
ncbi:MAG: polysulfide reductase NrfD [Chloroflexota bacterium]|nr:polysulfide reductase NrfD [Chloroflexota bacterium]MDE2941884.1 polysulfide reductase NrfD [Chloroflexota bacterium]MDE3268355.1 polysulfide reductase NrfD [Chloroflexota bacterium]